MKFLGNKRNIKDKRRKKLVLLIGLGCVLMFVLTSCETRKQEAVAEEKNLPEIVIGSDNYPPYNYEDVNGNRTGIDVDIAKEAFRRMGYRSKFILINWEEKKNLVESGKIDCIWGSFSIDGREKEYQWTKPYMYSRQVVAVRKSSLIHKLADLKGKRVAVQSTTKPEEILLSNLDPRIPQLDEVFCLQNRELIYPYLSKNYVDAIAAHETAILQCMSDYDLDYRILKESLLTVGLGVAFSKQDDRGLAGKLSKTFGEMKKDGSLEKIIGKYLDHPRKFMEVDADEK